jgi:hypothetical protein
VVNKKQEETQGRLDDMPRYKYIRNPKHIAEGGSDVQDERNSSEEAEEQGSETNDAEEGDG